MITVEDTFSLNILPMGQIEIKKVTEIIEDGVKISEKLPWRTVLEPGDFDKAIAILLPEYEMAILQAAWTEDKIAEYQGWKESQIT